MTKKKKHVIGVIDEDHLNAVFLKAALLEGIRVNMRIQRVQSWLLDYKEVWIPPPGDLRRSYKRNANENKKRALNFARRGEVSGFYNLLRKKRNAIKKDGDKIASYFAQVDRHNSNVMKALMIGQYSAAATGLLAGVGLVVFGTAGSIAIATAAVAGEAATATSVLCFTTGTALRHTGVSMLANISVSAARGWSDRASWSGIAIAAGSQAKTETVRQAAAYGTGGVAGLSIRAFNAIQDTFPNSQFLQKLNFAEAAKSGSKTVSSKLLPLVFASVDLKNEVGFFQKSLESPEQRARRHATR